MDLNNNCTLITTCSWEERFFGSFSKAVEAYSPTDVILCCYDTRHETNEQKVIDYCKEKGIGLSQPKPSYSDPKQTFMDVSKAVEQIKGRVVLDITTTPRELIWMVLDQVQKKSMFIHILYTSPRNYAKWLTKNPQKPRIVYRLGGETILRAPTKLLAITGFDTDRVRQLIGEFEPEEIRLGIQTGKQFENEPCNQTKARQIAEEFGARYFDVDAYSDDCGFADISTVIEEMNPSESNILMCSLGPKLSSLALFALHRKYPTSSLVYTPSKEYNPDYSKGIGDFYLKELTRESVIRNSTLGK